MPDKLSAHAQRVLGCLIEKEMATPEYYPLTLNALVNACNQKSNREPVLTLTDEEVREALEELRGEQLSYKSAEGVRTERYCHNVPGVLQLEDAELALLAVLLLRGAQTLGELRTRTERLYSFTDLAAVENALLALQQRAEPLVAQLPRQPGRKEHRYCQLLGEFCGDTELAAEDLPQSSRTDRIATLEQEVAELKEEVSQLKELFAQFRGQFE